jgi:hypothetical protein
MREAHVRAVPGGVPRRDDGHAVPGQPHVVQGDQEAGERLALGGRPHRELVALAEPPPDELVQLLLQLAADVAEGRRPGPAVEVLVGAADGEVRAGRGQVGAVTTATSTSAPDR